MTDSTRKPCVFCGSTSSKQTKEDVWPVWLTNDVGFESGFDHSVTRGQGSDARVIRSWSSKGGRSGSAQRVGGICKDCNTGWMAGIEGTAKPLLVPMRSAQSIVLGRREQKCLARWAYMKALVFSLATPEVTFPARDFARFHATRKPPHNSLVLLNACDVSLPGGRCKIDPLVAADDFTTKVWRVVLVTGHVVLQVFSDRTRGGDPLRTMVKSDQTFFRIWTSGDEVAWPPKKVLPPKELMGLLDYYKYPPEASRS